MDILEAVAVTMPRGSCSDHYEITLKQALLSHQMLHEGCPVSDERECPPLYFSDVADLQNLWSRLKDLVRKAGRELTLLGHS